MEALWKRMEDLWKTYGNKYSAPMRVMEEMETIFYTVCNFVFLYIQIKSYKSSWTLLPCFP